MDWILIGLIVSGIINIVLLYGCWNVLQKLKEYEVQYVATKRLLQNMLNGMREIDEQGMFEKDDEVGGVFEQLQILIEFYNKIV